MPWMPCISVTAWINKLDRSGDLRSSVRWVSSLLVTRLSSDQWCAQFENETKKPPSRPVPGPSGLQQTRPQVSPSQLPATGRIPSVTPGAMGATPVRQHRLQSPIVTERAPTPDPFASSPLDDEDDAETGLGGPLRPLAVSQVSPPPLPSSRSITSPTKSRTDVQRGYDLDDNDASSQLPGGTSMNSSVGKSSVGMGKSDVRGSGRDDDDIEESQLFPGSDLF